jgi:hypothetical protein
METLLQTATKNTYNERNRAHKNDVPTYKNQGVKQK